MGRPSAGVRGINPREGDYLVACVVVEPEAALMVVSENGMGKRTSFDEYKSKGRGGKGMKTLNVTEKTGPVCGATVVHDDDQIMLMTSSGQNVRIPVSDLRLLGRATQGVRLMKLKGDETIQDFAKVVSTGEEDEENAEGDDPSAPDGGDTPAKAENAPAEAEAEATEDDGQSADEEE